MDHFIDVYETMLGLRESGACVPGIEDAFADGQVCSEAYEEMRLCYRRLCDRLGAGDEDTDLNRMVVCMEQIQKELCRRMFVLKQSS